MPVNIGLKQKYLSIGELSCPGLPDFAVLTGRNGAGKTQLLQAIKEGHAVVPGIARNSIELYDLSSFRPPASAPGNLSSNQFARATARHYVDGYEGPAPIAVASEIFEQHMTVLEREGRKQSGSDFVVNIRERISKTPDFSVFPPRPNQEGSYLLSLHDRVWEPLRQHVGCKSKNREYRDDSFQGDPAALVTLSMKLSGKLPHELTYNDIVRASHYEGGTFENEISEVFAAYKLDQYEWAHARFETHPEAVRFADLLAEYHRRHPPPWEMLRDVMAEMRDASGEDGLFGFDFSDPADVRLGMSDFREFSFTTELTNRSSGARYALDALSSGEQILMTLCLASFNRRLGRRRPGLLLLDELDAMLHPSMITALVAALRSLFVDHGCKVLMTTHSPMTVAAIQETDVFRVIRKGTHVRVDLTTTAAAVEELSEGIATVDAGLRIAAAGGAEVTILTEGHNARHLKRWVELNFPQGVLVFDHLAGHTGKGQLLTYGRMLGAMQPDTHFVIVWDCDAADQAQTLREQLPSDAKVTPFAFRRRDNQIARRGIENNYDENILLPYVIVKMDNEGRELGREFNGRRKAEFANHVQQEGTDAHFAHYGELHEVVSGILASARKPAKQ